MPALGRRQSESRISDHVGGAGNDYIDQPARYSRTGLSGKVRVYAQLAQPALSVDAMHFEQAKKDQPGAGQRTLRSH